METKQTAVNFLRDEAIKLIVQAMQGTLNENTLEHQISQIVTKAMAMEREQIIDAYNSARNDHHQMYFADEYFNKKYGGQDE